MSRDQRPGSIGESDGRSALKLFRAGNDVTETIDLNSLFPGTLTESGSFDLTRIKYATFEKLLEAISVPTLLISPTHSITFANSAFEKVATRGFDTRTAAFSDLFTNPMEARKAQVLLDGVFRDRKPEVRETVLGIGETRMWARIHLRTIRIGSDRFVLVQIENLTAQKQLLAVQKYKKLVNLFPIGIVELGIPRPLDCGEPIDRLLDAILNAKVVDGNNEFASMYDRSAIGDLKGVRLERLFPAEGKSKALYEEWIKSGFPIRSFETKETTATGDVRYFENILIGNVNNRRFVGFWWLKRDISEKKSQEQEILRAQKLQSLGILAGGIAHDFNNLLTAILGNISLAKDYLSPSEKAFERMVAATRAVERAQQLTAQLLTFSRGGAPVKRKASMGELLRDSVEFVLRGSSVRSVLSIADDLWPVEVDETQMHRVIHNLVLNALQAMPQGGAVHVRAENLALTGNLPPPLNEGRYVRVAIRDSGAGIAREILDKIFDPYFTTKEKGTGLGLASAYSIVKNHGGMMTVKSRIGLGSIFYFYLPAASGVCEAREENHGTEVRHKAKILVMDDDELIRDLVTELLGAMGFEVSLARDGAEAIAAYVRERQVGRPFDVVVMDVTIPGGMGGKEAIQKLTAIDPGVKAIVSSGYSNDAVMAEYEKHGFVGVLPKPYTPNEIVELLEAVLSLPEEQGRDSS